MLNYLNAGAFAPDFQLVDGCRAEGIRRRQQNGFSVLFETVRQFADGRRLAYAIYANDEHHRRSGQILLFLRPFGKHLRNFFNQHAFYQGRVCCMFLFHPVPQTVHDFHCRLHTQVRHNEGFFQFLKQVLVYLRKASQNTVHAVHNIAAGLVQPFLQPCEKAFFGLRVRLGFLPIFRLIGSNCLWRFRFLCCYFLRLGSFFRFLRRYFLQLSRFFHCHFLCLGCIFLIQNIWRCAVDFNVILPHHFMHRMADGGSFALSFFQHKDDFLVLLCGLFQFQPFYLQHAFLLFLRFRHVFFFFLKKVK